jgi:hypothetical protein
MVPVLFAYFGPETMMPLTSIAATVVGLFLMFGRNSLRMVLRMFRFPLKRSVRTETLPRPHFSVQADRKSSQEAPRS